MNTEEIIKIAKELLESGEFTKEDYDECLKGLVEDSSFNGKLKTEEFIALINAKVSSKKITKIDGYLDKYKDHLTGFRDLVGDTGIPSNMFYFIMDHFGYLLDDNPENVINEKNVRLRKLVFDKLIKTFGPKFLSSKQIFEDRNNLKQFNQIKADMASYSYSNPTSYPFSPEKGIILPDTPVIWTPNHHFKDDVLCSYIATKRAAYILFGSMPQFYNTIDGILAHMVGSLMTNRKMSSSKHASTNKAIRAMELGADILCFPEGVWNKYPNELLIKYWSGVYRIANETGAPVVPIVNYIKDPTLVLPKEENPIHTVVDDPIDITKYSEKAGLDYLRDVMATWYYIMMEKYGKTTRGELMSFYQERASHYGVARESFDKRPITSHEAFEIYMLDLLQTVDRYDSEIEHSAHYQPRNIINPEKVFQDITKIESNPNNVFDVIHARELVRTRAREDYQRRF